MRRKSLLSFVFVAAGVLLSLEGRSYVLSADEILASVAGRRAQIAFETLVAKGIHQQGNERPHPVWEAIKAGKARRVELEREQGTAVELTVGRKRWSFDLGSRTTAPRSADDLILSFVGTTEPDPGGKRGLRFLEARNVDANVVTLARQNGRPVYVIGAKPWEPDKPQLWVDKELRVPVRLVEVDASGAVHETRLLGFGSALTGEWYPMRIERREKGELVESFTYESAELNVAVDDALFTPPS